jgi:hypothetical protein
MTTLFDIPPKTKAGLKQFALNITVREQAAAAESDSQPPVVVGCGYTCAGGCGGGCTSCTGCSGSARG